MIRPASQSRASRLDDTHLQDADDAEELVRPDLQVVPDEAQHEAGLCGQEEHEDGVGHQVEAEAQVYATPAGALPAAPPELACTIIAGSD